MYKTILSLIKALTLSIGISCFGKPHYYYFTQSVTCYKTTRIIRLSLQMYLAGLECNACKTLPNS